MVIQKEDVKNNLVLGQVTDKFKRGLSHLLVQAFDRDMRSEVYLGECITDRAGKYRIPWSASLLYARDKKQADIAVKVFKAQSTEQKILLFELAPDDIRFNARDREEINITIETDIPVETPEYERILSEVSALAKDVPIAELQENDKHRDITFLSRESEIPAGKIVHLVAAQRLSAASKIDPEFFYALLRKNTLLKNSFQESFHVRLTVDLNTEILPLIYDAALTDQKIIKTDVAAAVRSRLVSEKVSKELKTYIELLQRFKEPGGEYYKNERPRKVLNVLSRFLLEDKLSQIVRLFQDNKNNFGGFLQKVTDEGFFRSDESKQQAEAALALGQLLGFNETIITQVSGALDIGKTADLRKLAMLNKLGWKELLIRSAAEMNLAGQPLDKKMAELHASTLTRKMEKAFPTAAFTAQLAREKKPVLKHGETIREFLIQNEDFDLARTQVDLFLKEKKLDVGELTPIREELKSVQRIFKLVPHYGKTNGLLSQNLHSAQGIVALGKTRFIREAAPKAGIPAREAREIFKKAERSHAAAMLIIGELQDTHSAMNIPAMEMKSLSLKMNAVSNDFPNLKSLFQLSDVCACEQCRSVYSPAAYLVEIIQFLENRGVVDLTVPAPPPPAVRPTLKVARDVLFERRPDLGDIDLGCENAHTPVPYIDLACELLEEAVAPDPGILFNGVLSDGPNPLAGRISAALLTALQAKGLPVTEKALIFPTETASGSSATLPHYLRDKKVVCKIIPNGGNSHTIFRLRQTLSSAEELSAAPEYVSAAAYNALRSKTSAFQLPFDLNHTEASAYFSRFDIPRAMLMADFQSAGTPADAVIAAEKLNLTDAERQLIITPNPANQKTFWNTSVTPAANEMKTVAAFLTKTGLDYSALNRLLALDFIDPGKLLFIKHLDLSCDTAQKEIAGLNDAALDRIHRFLRLQRKTQWSFEVLDEIISQPHLGNGLLNDPCLVKAADILTLSLDTGIPVSELIGFFGTIPHQIRNEGAHVPLYQHVFLNKAKNGFVDEALLPAKVDGSQILSNVKGSLSVCLQLPTQDFDILSPILPNQDLTFANLSLLFAASRFLRKLKIKAADFVVWVRLTGLNLQASPRNALNFVSAVRNAREFPLKPADIRFMLRHETPIPAERELKDAKITLTLEKLQKEFQKTFDSNRSPFDPHLLAEEQAETLEDLLSRLKDISDADVKIMLGFVDRQWASAAAAKTFIANKLSPLFAVTPIHNAIDALAAAPGPNLKAERLALVRAFADTVAAYHLNIEKQAILEQILSAAFKANNDHMNIILTRAALRQPGPNTPFLSAILLGNSLIDTDISHPVPILPSITPASFPDHYRSLRLLHKLIPLVNSFKLDSDDIRWFLENNRSLGWFEWDSIPYQAGQTPVDYQKYSAFMELMTIARQLTPVPNPADVENPVSFRWVATALTPGSPVQRGEFIEKFSLLNGFEKDLADAVDAHLFPVFSLAHYRNPAAWRSVSRCIEHLRKLGGSVAQVKEFIKPLLTASDTLSLRLALKARYDEDTWLGVLKEIMDAIRPQKRNALIAYLLIAHPTLKDENDLFDYFLVDVKTEACMPSSRIVQAHSSIQLFAQRCLMGLEPAAAADINNDNGWEQWKWMKNYRIWEANRKVFLYPENWIEAELRDDKSFLFTELENELLQNEVNEFTAAEALVKYLEKLDNLAFLEVVATWYETGAKIMHVFARTKGGDPAAYYYRKFEQERYWTPWEKVDLDITSDHLLAFIRNNRLSLAWPVFSNEPDPNPQSTIPDATPNKVIDNDKPKRKLKIQLAISEFANKKWQPKKISKQGVLTPSSFTTGDLPKEKYNLIYFEYGDQVWLLSSHFSHGQELSQLNGIFNIAGCKGYPELLFQGEQHIPDFLPDFKDSLLLSQRYTELNIDPDDLSVRNGVSFFSFFEILAKTPGTFRITYPHQATFIDGVALLFQYIFLYALGGSGGYTNERYKTALKLPLGTLLPYFKEDSNHAYVIIPGFYHSERDPQDNHSHLSLQSRRTASDVLKLIEDIIALFNKYAAILNQDPSQDLNVLFQMLLADNDFQEIVAELKNYETLRYGEQFRNAYHPLVCALRKILYNDGVAGLMKRETQLQSTSFDFNDYYAPNHGIVPQKPYHTWKNNGDILNTRYFPIQDIDFDSDGGYSGYNWELFFHIPLLLATRLTKNQRFEEAMTWFHYMFNPTGALEGEAPQKYWVTKPFFLTHTNDYINQRIDALLYKIADPNSPELAELEFAVHQWRSKPFKPHAIARFRPVAYQKALVMKYIDLLTEWGDYLFRQDTMESVAQATQMYILADKLLGSKPRIVPPAAIPPYQTYNQIAAGLGAFGDALIDLENILPDISVLPEGGAEMPPAPITLSMLYFCIPPNDKMMEYWDRIADRLFKIRHCLNIDGVERNLALFAPPIDPGMLVRAAASGLDISSVLAGFNAPAPYYRFSILSQKASELAGEVRNLGSSLLQTLEKKDAEALSLLRSELEIKALNAVKDMKVLQIKESKEQIESLKLSKKVIDERHRYYAQIKKISAKEQLNLDKLGESKNWQLAANITYALGAGLALIPDFALGASGFGGSPHGAAKFGGSLLAHSTDAIGKGLSIFSAIASYEASRASILGGYDRRYDDWKLQERLAARELTQINQQITAAEIRREMAEADLKNHLLQIDNAQKTDDFMRSKFTNEELYQWMISQISSVYFRAYQLAHDFAKKAERSYRFELGNDDSYIQFGYWDSMKKGLQSADHLVHDIKRMEAGYMDRNKREYEITKHVSLALLDPLAIVRLRATGVCDFDIPEAMFDLDHAGHYFRRIKTVSISLPCIAGPYTSVSAKLSLTANKYRKTTAPGAQYAEDPGNDSRFVYNVGAIQSIAASNGQNDSGMFELNFRDDRYLPFEGTGAVSNWRLELPKKELAQFDYDTISDVIVHLRYTAREGGSTLRSLAETSLKTRLAEIRQQLSQTGLHIVIDLKHDMPNQWHLFRKNAAIDLTIGTSRLPYIAQALSANAAIDNVMFIAKVKNNPASFAITVNSSSLPLARIDEWKLCRGSSSGVTLDTPFELAIVPAQLNNLEELMMIVKYRF